MGANESARQAGSNDTILDPWLTPDGFAVGMLSPTAVLSGPSFSTDIQHTVCCKAYAAYYTM